MLRALRALRTTAPHSAPLRGPWPASVTGVTFRDPLFVRWLVVAATLWAAFSRFHRITALPPQAWVDEIWIAIHARELLQTGAVQVFYKTFWGGMHPLLVHLTAFAQWASFDSLIASRLISTASGVITIPLAFACFDELLRGQLPPPRRRLIAALTAVILSNLLYAVVVSRVGYEPALVPVPILICVWQLRRAQRTHRWASWVGAGLALGLAQYLSHHGRFLIPLVGLLALHDLIRRRRGGFSMEAGSRSAQLQPVEEGARKQKITTPFSASVFGEVPLVYGMGLSVVIAIIVALPLIVFFIREPEWLFARARAVTAIPRQTGPSFLLDNLGLVLASFSFQGDASLRHNLAGRPMFDWIQSIGFWAGIVWAVVHFRRAAQARDLLIWIVVMMVPSLITDEAPQFERLIGLAAPAAALVAIGWVEIWLWVSQRLDRVKAGEHGKKPVEAANWAAALLVVTSLGWNAYDYFVRYPAAPGLDATFTTTPVALARQLIERAALSRYLSNASPRRTTSLPLTISSPGRRCAGWISGSVCRCLTAARPALPIWSSASVIRLQWRSSPGHILLRRSLQSNRKRRP